MRARFALMALLLPLGGCVVPPGQVGYGYGYPGAYPSPGYPGAYGQPDYGYPGYSYYDNSPTLAVDGATMPLIFYGGGWGYWDGGHNWHHAPDGVARNLNQRYPGGTGYRAAPVGHVGGPPPGGGFGGHPLGSAPPGGGFAGRPPGVAPVSAPRGPALPPGAAAHSPIAAAVSHIPPPSGQKRDDHH
jgi:hypothetical protein